jgi:hypothetical protein
VALQVFFRALLNLINKVPRCPTGVSYVLLRLQIKNHEHFAKTHALTIRSCQQEHFQIRSKQPVSNVIGDRSFKQKTGSLRDKSNVFDMFLLRLLDHDRQLRQIQTLDRKIFLKVDDR